MNRRWNRSRKLSPWDDSLTVISVWRRRPISRVKDPARQTATVGLRPRLGVQLLEIRAPALRATPRCTWRSRKNPRRVGRTLRWVRARHDRRRRSPRARAAAIVGSRRGSSPAIAIDPVAQAKPLKDGRLTGAILADEKCHRRVELEGCRGKRSHRRHRKWIPIVFSLTGAGGSSRTPRRWITPFSCGCGTRAAGQARTNTSWA